MNLNKILLPFLIVFFGAIIFLKTGFYDFDSYYHLSLACGKVSLPQNATFFVYYFLKSFPCNEGILKLVIIFIFSLCTYITYRIGKLESARFAYLAPLVFGLSITYYSYFAKFEDDIFAYPIIFLSLYFLVKSFHSNNWLNYFISLVLSLFGMFFWYGAGVWVILVLLANPFFILPAIFFVIDQGPTYLFNRNPLVSEDTIGVGISSILLLLIGLINLQGSLILPFLFATLLSFYKLKYTLFLGLILGYGSYRFFVKKEFYENDLKKIFGFSKKDFLLMILIVFNLAFAFSVYYGPPTGATIDLVQKSVHLSGGALIQNDWPLGHMITYFGGIAENHFGPPNNPIDTNSGIKIFYEKLPCENVSTDGTFTIYNCGPDFGIGRIKTS